MLNIRAKFHESLTFTFREITSDAVLTNERTNWLANKHDGSQYLLAELMSYNLQQ